MQIGLMWYDGDARRPATVKLAEAIERYVERFGERPNCCHVAPGSEFASDDVTVVGDRWIRPGFLWLGLDETLSPATGERPISDPRPAVVDAVSVAPLPIPTTRRRVARRAAPLTAAS